MLSLTRVDYLVITDLFDKMFEFLLLADRHLLFLRILEFFAVIRRMGTFPFREVICYRLVHAVLRVRDLSWVYRLHPLKHDIHEFEPPYTRVSVCGKEPTVVDLKTSNDR